jgi:hypothetical protein
MTADLRKTAELGEVVAAAFDQAADYSINPSKVSRLVTRAVVLMLRNQGVRPTPSRRPLFIAQERS